LEVNFGVYTSGLGEEWLGLWRDKVFFAFPVSKAILDGNVAIAIGVLEASSG
jgi:hypothetical protein